MPFSRSLNSITTILIFIIILMIVAISPSQAKARRRVRWWQGGTQVAFNITKSCTDELSFDFLITPDNNSHDDNPDEIEVTLELLRTGDDSVYTLPLSPEQNDNIEVWQAEPDGSGEYVFVDFTHEASGSFDLSMFEPELGDRITITINISNVDNVVESFYATIDCAASGVEHYFNNQGAEDFPAPPSPILPNEPSCTVGTAVQQYERVVNDTATIGALDVAMYFIPANDMDNLRAELTSPSGTTVTLWENFSSHDSLGSRCDTDLQGDPTADFIMSDHSSFSFPENNDLPTYDRAYQPMEALSTFAGEPLNGTWTLNICDITPVSTIDNGDFENGPTDWTQYSSQGYTLIRSEEYLPITPHSGSWATWLGGAFDYTSQIYQIVSVPVQSPILSYWHWIASSDSCGNDFARIFIEGSQAYESVIDMCNTTNGWTQRSLDLSTYAGIDVNLVFEVTTNSTLNSNQFLDDITWQNGLLTSYSSVSFFDPPFGKKLESQKISEVTLTDWPMNEQSISGRDDSVQCWYLDVAEVEAPPQPTVAFDQPSYSILENGIATITARLSHAYVAAVTVDYATSDMDALANVDYAPISGTLTFLPNETVQTFTVMTLPDMIYEGDEDVGLALSNPSNASLGVIDSAILTIMDDEELPTAQFSLSDYVVNEDAGTVQIEVTLSGSSAEDVMVDFATSDGTAVAGEDYTAVSTITLTFTPGEISQTVDITILQDSLFDPAETINLTLSNVVGAVMGVPFSAILTISDEAIPIVQFSLSNFIVAEDVGTAQIEVTLSKPATDNVMVDFATVNGTAVAGEDYTAVPLTTLTFAPGETSKTVDIIVFQDTEIEPAETVILILNNATGGDLGTLSFATLTINDVSESYDLYLPVIIR